MPVFGGGTSRFQPIFVGDLARLVEICSHTENSQVTKAVQGKVLEAGGPEGRYPLLPHWIILTCSSIHV